MLPTAHTGQTGRRRHVRNKNCYQAGDVSIYHRTSTEFNRHGTGDHKRPSNGTRGPAPNGRSNWGTGPHGGCSYAKVSYNHSILHHSKYTSVHHPAWSLHVGRAQRSLHVGNLILDYKIIRHNVRIRNCKLDLVLDLDLIFDLERPINVVSFSLDHQRGTILHIRASLSPPQSRPLLPQAAAPNHEGGAGGSHQPWRFVQEV